MHKKNNTTNDGDVQYLFAGQKSRTSNYSLLDQAIKLEDVGKATSEEIRQQTGWFRGYDGKWRYEIDDSKITITKSDKDYLQKTSSTLLGYLIKHDELFEAYPQLKDVMVYVEDGEGDGDAYYNPKYKTITLKSNALSSLSDNGLKGILIHEIQHAIQDIEGFTSGTDTSDFAKYLNTAGEIEAYDAGDRINLTAEQRKNTRPDIDRTDVVFASNGSHWLSAKEAQYDPETASVSKQIKNSQDVLNRMNIVGSAVAPENLKTKYEAAQWAISQLKATGYQVDRQNFGKIYFEENDIRKGAEYADTYEEKAAFLLIPKVLKRGIEIGRHGNHKLRQKATVTFAAPVMLNGIRGNMAVVVNLNSNRYKVHRIILPDGTTFKFSTKKEVKQESYQGVTENSSLADTTSFTSNSRISQTNATVNNNISEESENYSSPEQNNDGNSYSFGDIDKGNKKRDNISRANEQGELINEFYYALDKSEWNLFYRKIAESGFLEKTDVGDVVAVSIGGKLIIAERQMTGTDAHDFQLVDAYQENNGDSFIINEIADSINESEDIYDQRTVEKTILRVSKIYDETPIFSVYDREHMQFISSSSFGKTNGRSTTTDGGYRTRTYGEGISSSTEQNMERSEAGLDNSAFSMPENDGMEYSFEGDVVDKTSSLAERVRLGEISQTEYLNELRQLMDEATEKYGAIPKGENPVVSNLSELNSSCSYPISNARQKL